MFIGVVVAGKETEAQFWQTGEIVLQNRRYRINKETQDVEIGPTWIFPSNYLDYHGRRISIHQIVAVISKPKKVRLSEPAQ